MRFRVFVLNLLRLILLIVSAGALACHVAQHVLLEQYANDHSNLGNWWPEYVPYILYYVGPGFSLLSSIVLVILSMTRLKSIIGDRLLSAVNLALMIAVIVYNTLKSGTIPWTNGIEQPRDTSSSNIKAGYATYCSSYSDVTFYRCWLVNGAWMGVVILGFLWLLLLLYTVIQKSSSFYVDWVDNYDYKQDVPMANSALHGYEYPFAAAATSPAAGSPVSAHKGYVYEDGSQVNNNTYYTYPDYYDTNRQQQNASASYDPHLARPYPANSHNSTSGTATPPYGNAGYGSPQPGDSEKIAVQTPTTEYSTSQPPHSHDGRYM